MDALTDPIASPCTGICRIGDDGRCAGCRRTLDEIAAWPTMTPAQREQIIATLPDRPDPTLSRSSSPR